MDIANLYETLPAQYRDKQITYANYEDMKISLPNRFLLVAGTGFGKTNLLLNLIQKFNCFKRFYLFAKDLDEPLYRWFIDVLRKAEENLSKKAKKPVQVLMIVSTDLDDLPSVESIDKEDGPHCFIFDDMQSVSDKKQLKRLKEQWQFGRKKNICSFFLAQNYYGVDTDLRKNTGIFLLKNLGSNKNKKALLKELAEDIDPDDLERMFNEAEPEKLSNFFLIDNTAGSKREYKYRKNFTPIS